MEKKVAIIGAGISGLLACKYTLSKGFTPTVFESASTIGGVWTKTIATTKLQTPKDAYQFSDFPWPSSVTEDFPNQNQVLDYIQSYARHFGLIKHIKFNTRVCGVEYENVSQSEMLYWSHWGGAGEPFSSRGKWKVIVEDEHLTTKVYLVDFVILCIGRFSGVPNIPEFPQFKGPEVFRGKVIHSMDYVAMDNESARKFVKGKQVTVVGLQKSALDIAMECSTTNGLENPCTVVYKTEHWNIPDNIPWGVPLLDYLYLNRFSELLVHKPGEGILLSLLASLFSPLRWAFSKFVESYIDKKLGLTKYGMVPKHSFLQDLSSCQVSIVPEKFYNRIEEGSIKLKKCPNSFSFCPEGILVDGENAPVKTDLVILATGFRGDKKIKDIFVCPRFQDYIAGSSDAAIPLYRECINSRIPQLAIIGFSESVSNLYTSEMRCRWLAEFIGGTFRLPSIKEMDKDVKQWQEYAKRYSGKYYQRSSIAAIHIWYNDQLCKDMGWNPRRKKGLFSELFEPYGPRDYACS